MVRISGRRRWMLALILGLGGLIGMAGVQAHGGHGVTVAPASFKVAGDLPPLPPKS